MKCGIMDQFAISLSKKNHALFLDCRNLEYEFIPLELKDTVTIIGNTKVKRTLVDSKYNERREECEQAVRIIAGHEPKVKQLRDVNPDMLTKYKLPETVKKRCEHVVYENERVKKAADSLKNSQMEEFGRLMIESHYSLRDLYEVSCTELDTMVESALKIKGTKGSRMTGAGFGGCTVNLVNKDTVNEFMEKVGIEYKNKTGIQADFYVCTPENGIEEIID
jgi:galactokinase